VDNEIILKQSRQVVTLKVYEGPGFNLKAWQQKGLTDLFGDVPYFTAFNGTEGITTPVYDSQESIYFK
jgi:hypothetical protein